MKGRADCPDCLGRGVILDADPLVPARPCPCVRELTGDAPLGIPARYRQAAFDGFWEWWKIQHPKDKLSRMLEEAHQMMELSEARSSLPAELASKLDLILHRCGSKVVNGEVTWKDLKPALEPQGYRSLFNWAKQGQGHGDLWWIDGPPGSGRSTLAAATLKALSARTREPGLFISVRTFSQELKDVYYDTRSFQNRGFLSERDRMEPLLSAPFLVLDDLDRMDSDLRVIRAFAQLLDHRYAEERPTLLTASRWVEVLQAGGPESLSLTRLEDPNLLRRLAQSRRVALRPTLEGLVNSGTGQAP